MTNIESTATESADTIPAAELAIDATEMAEQAITPDAPETPDSDDMLDDTDGETVDETADTFPRAVVEKLRRESAGFRDRAKSAEGRAEQAEGQLAAVQRQLVGRQVAAGGMKPSAVFAVAQLDDLLSDDGAVDTAKVQQAMATARDVLGVGVRRNPYGRGGFVSGATGSLIESPQKGFASAFRRSDDD